MKEKEGEVVPFDPDEFSECVPRDSKVTRNKNKKTISVSNAFDCNRIPIKIIASYEEWLKLEAKFFKTNKIAFKELKPVISRPSKQNIKAFKSYCDRENEYFSLDFYYYYIRPSKKKNPLCSPKPRGGSPYDKTPAEMFEVRIKAVFLYVFFSYWFKHKPVDLPQVVKEFFKKYYVSYNRKLSNPSGQAISATMAIVARHFNLDIDKIKDPKNFYDKYIARTHLTTIRRMLDYVGYLPVPVDPPIGYPLFRYPLKDLA